MKFKFSESQCELVDSAYKPQKGMFAQCKHFKDGRHKIDHWWYCREIFHNVLKNLNILSIVNNSSKNYLKYNDEEDYEDYEEYRTCKDCIYEDYEACIQKLNVI